jgi:hypothetical protein
MVLFAISSERLWERATCMSDTRHQGTSRVLSYIRADRITSQLFPFLSELSQVLRSDDGRATPSTWAYFLRRRESYSLCTSYPRPLCDPSSWCRRSHPYNHPNSLGREQSSSTQLRWTVRRSSHHPTPPHLTCLCCEQHLPPLAQHHLQWPHYHPT